MSGRQLTDEKHEKHAKHAKERKKKKKRDEPTLMIYSEAATLHFAQHHAMHAASPSPKPSRSPIPAHFSHHKPNPQGSSRAYHSPSSLTTQLTTQFPGDSVSSLATPSHAQPRPSAANRRGKTEPPRRTVQGGWPSAASTKDACGSSHSETEAANRRGGLLAPRAGSRWWRDCGGDVDVVRAWRILMNCTVWWMCICGENIPGMYPYVSVCIRMCVCRYFVHRRQQ